MSAKLLAGFGQCGINLADEFVANLMKEHKINEDGQFVGKGEESALQHINAYFHETRDGLYYPKVFLCDFSQEALNCLTAGPRGKLYHPNTLFSISHQTNGLYIQAPQSVKEDLRERFRKNKEVMGQSYGFHIFSSSAGASGGRLSAYFTEFIGEEKDDRQILKLPTIVLPNCTAAIMGPNNLEVYNTILSMGNQISKYNTAVHLLRNDALMNNATALRGVLAPTFKDANKIVADTFADLTSGSRWKGHQNWSLGKILTNVGPLLSNYFTTSLTELKSPVNRPGWSDEKFLVRSAFSHKNTGVYLKDMRSSGVIASSWYVRGSLSTFEVESEVVKLKRDNPALFWNITRSTNTIGYCDVPRPDTMASGVLCINSSAVIKSLSNEIETFEKAFRRKSWVHHYTQEGIDEMEFTEAESNLSDVIKQQSVYDKSVVSGIDDDDREEE